MYTSCNTTFVSTLFVRMGERHSLITTRVPQDEAIHNFQKTHAWSNVSLKLSYGLGRRLAGAHRASSGLHFALRLSPDVSQGMHYRGSQVSIDMPKSWLPYLAHATGSHL